MNPFPHAAPAALACILGTALLACEGQPHDAAASPASESAAWPGERRESTPFERDLLALKAQGLEPKALFAAAAALRAKHGLPPVGMPQPALDADMRVPLPPETLDPDASLPQALAKSAGAMYSKYFQVKFGRILYYFAHYHDVSVGPGRGIQIASGAVDDGTDPVVIAFYKSASGQIPEAYRVKIVAFNDDQPGTVDAKASWNNQTGSTKTVRVMAFVQAGMEGKTSFDVRIPPFGTAAEIRYSTARFTSASPYYDNITPEATSCTGPYRSSIKLVKDYSQGYGGGILAFNSTTMNGGYIREASATQTLKELLPSGAPNMVLGFYEGKNFTVDDIDDLPYSNFYYYQEDQYSCPYP